LQSVSHETRNDAIAARVAQITIIDTLQVLYSLRHLEQSIKTEQRIINAIVQKTY
jgi:DNA-binding MurR/RpiR family transcriptional regulator